MGGVAKAIGSIFGGGSTPKITMAAPSEDTEAVKEAARKQRLAAASARGRNSTLLTGGAGLMGPANTKRKTLLGQ